MLSINMSQLYMLLGGGVAIIGLMVGFKLIKTYLKLRDFEQDIDFVRHQLEKHNKKETKDHD